jgi:hypothetical protein
MIERASGRKLEAAIRRGERVPGTFFAGGLIPR